MRFLHKLGLWVYAFYAGRNGFNWDTVQMDITIRNQNAQRAGREQLSRETSTDLQLATQELQKEREWLASARLRN
jgi:hypothetical protein